MANTPPIDYFGRDSIGEDPFDLFPELESSALDYTHQMFHPPQQQPFVPVSPIGTPSTSLIIDPCHFTAKIRLPDEKPQTCFFSTLLDRVYMNNMNNKTELYVEFNWDHTRFTDSMYVRSMMVFADGTQTSNRVEACVQHYHKALADGVSETIAKHVMLSSRSVTDGVYYCGVPDQSDSWLSVLVEFHKTSAAACHHTYQFVCKNSCATGINRRATKIIFTLEDKWGNVFGRQEVGVRVCASPCRDLQFDEKKQQAGPGARKRRSLSQRSETQNTRTRRVRAQRGHMITLPPLPIVNSRIGRTGLLMFRLMTELVAEHAGDDRRLYQNCMTSIEAIDHSLTVLNETTHR